MNAPRTPQPVIELSPEHHAISKILNDWGYSSETNDQEIVRMATYSEQFHRLRVGEAIAELRLATKEQVETALKDKPESIKTLEHLADRIDGVRSQFQMILALQNSLCYYRRLPADHPAVTQNAQLQRACKDLNAALVETPLGMPCLIFTTYEDAISYKKKGVAEKRKDPIRMILGDKNIIIAVGINTEVSSRINLTSEVDDERNLQHITARQATTEAQRVLLNFIDIALAKKSTNLAIQPTPNGQVVVRMRRFGDMTSKGLPSGIQPSVAAEMAATLHRWSNSRYTTNKQRVQGEHLLAPADGQFVYNASDVQVNIRVAFTAPDTLGGHPTQSISMRLLPRDQVDIQLSKLRVAQAVVDALDDAVRAGDGMIAIVGPTGAGKSTLLHAAITLYRQVYGDRKNILSGENPVERLIAGMVSHSISKGVGYEELMEAFLRQDPDFLMFGEVRDRSSASIAVRASNTGHLVGLTGHSKSPLGFILALRSYISNHHVSSGSSIIVSDFDMIDCLRLVISQRLVPELCKCSLPLAPNEIEKFGKRLIRHCEHEGELPKNKDEQDTMLARLAKIVSKARKHNPEGCTDCNHEGYIGELPINQVFHVTAECKELLTTMLAANRIQPSRLAKFYESSLFNDALSLVEQHKTPVDSLFA